MGRVTNMGAGFGFQDVGGTTASRDAFMNILMSQFSIHFYHHTKALVYLDTERFYCETFSPSIELPPGV